MTPTLWFTADHHFGHANIIRFSRRPFANLEAMNEALIQRWNQVVGPQDIVYHLGDIFLMPASEARPIRERLNGRICLIRGNHDRAAESLKSGFGWIKDLYELKVEDAEASGEERRIVLCHYAMRVWNK